MAFFYRRTFWSTTDHWLRWGPDLTFFESFEVRILTFFYVRNEVRSLNFLVRLRGKFVPQFSSIFNKTFFDLKNLMKILVFFWSKISNCCIFFAKKAFHRKYFCFFWRKIKILENINAQKHNKQAWGINLSNLIFESEEWGEEKLDVRMRYLIFYSMRNEVKHLICYSMRNEVRSLTKFMRGQCSE